MTSFLEIKLIEPATITACIAGFSALVLASWNFYLSKKNQTDIEVLKNSLAEQKSDNDARRDYEYEAKKRLYQEYEPLLFQLIETSINAVYRIQNLSKSVRNGDLGENGWLSRFNYYTKSTIYKLFAPLAIFKLMQQKITFIDLAVDKSIGLKYKLIKQLYLCYTDDFELARLHSPIEYDPNNISWKELRVANPIKYCRQGLPMGLLDKTLELFIEKEEDGKEYLISYGTFEKKIGDSYDNKSSPIHFSKELFFMFHPVQRPILWRIIITQLLILNILIRLGDMDLKNINESTVREILLECNEEYMNKYMWSDDLTLINEMQQPFKVAKEYLNTRFNK